MSAEVEEGAHYTMPRPPSPPFVVLALIALAGPALAQTPPPVLQAPPAAVTRPVQPPVEPGVIPGPSTPGATAVPTGAERVPVTPAAIDLEGNTVYSAADLAPLIQPLIGKTTTAAEIFQLAAKIERKYHDDGYFLAMVVVPPQRVADGRVRLRVYEGAISNVVVEGDVGPVVEQARAYLGKISGKQAVNLRDIERYLLLTQDIPGIRTRAVMRPGKEPGVSELVVQLTRKWGDLLHQVDNRGSKFTGPQQNLITGALNSFSQFGERFEATYFTTFDNESNFGQVAASFLVGSEGLRIRAYGAKGWINPGEQVAVTGYAGLLTLAGFSANFPVLRSRNLNVNVNGGFDYYQSIVDTVAGRINSTDLRMLRLGFDASYRDAFNGVTYGNVRMSKGLSILGASRRGDTLMARQGSDPEFFKVQGEISRLQGIYAGTGFSVNLFATMGWQYTNDVLPSSEKFFLGGDRFGRGYYAGQVTGDRAIVGSLELQLNVVIPYGEVDSSTAVSDSGATPGLPIQIYGFVDYGRAWNLLATETQAITARSVGAGVRVSVLERMQVEAEAVRRFDVNVDGATATALSPWAGYVRATTRF